MLRHSQHFARSFLMAYSCSATPVLRWLGLRLLSLAVIAET